MTTPTTVSVRLQLRADTAANWTSANPTLLANELGRETDTGKIKIGDGSTAWSSLAYQAWATLPIAVASGGTGQTSYTNGQLLIGNTTGNTLTKATLTAGSGIAITNGPGSITVAASGISDAQIAADAEIAVSKLADGTARQLLQTDAAGTGVEWASNIDIPGTLDVTSAATFDSTIGASAGTASLPSITFTGDLNTGIYSPGADQVAISTNGQGRLFVNSSGQVGIGSAPDRRLTVANTGGDSTVNILASTTGESVLYFADSTAGTGSYAGYFQYIHSTDNLAIGCAAGEAIRIDSSRRVGVGTSSPSNLLHVSTNSNATTTVGLFENASTGAGVYQQIQLKGGTHTLTLGLAGSGTSGSAYIGSDQAKDLTVYTGAANLTLQTNSTPRMTITSGGSVGVGTTSPSTSLHVGGSSDQSVQINGSGTAAFVGTSTAVAQISSNRNPTTGAIYDSGRAVSYINLEASSGNANIQFYTTATNNVNATERARIDSSGRLLVGTSSARSNFFNASVSSQFLVESTGTFVEAALVRNQATASGGALILGKSRSTSAGGNAAVISGDQIGFIDFQAADGSELVSCGSIEAQVDGTPGANDMPGRLVFSTTADGASSPTERMRITSGGYFKASNDGSYISTTSSNHEFVQNNTSEWGLQVYHKAAATGNNGVYINYPNRAPNDTSNSFLYCNDSGALRAQIRSNGGLANYSANNANLSDRNAKKDITPAADTWNCIKEWEIVNYRYKDQPDDADLNLGVIAQQVAESCPEVITVFEEAKDDQPEKLGVKEQQMYWMAIKALQEAMSRIETLEAEVTALKAA